MAVHDPESGELQSLCRVMSGFTDAFYQDATQRLRAKTITAPPSYYVTGESPSVWFDSGEVWEIRGAELTASPVSILHTATCSRVRGGLHPRPLLPPNLAFPRPRPFVNLCLTGATPPDAQVHMAAHGRATGGRGLALRFPRFLSIRVDKVRGCRIDLREKDGEREDGCEDRG